MTPLLRALCAAVLCAAPLSAQSSTHVRLVDPDARRLSRELEASGFDVVEGSVRARALEVVATEAELEELRVRGLALEVIAIGRPYAEIQREASGGPEAVPSGYPTGAQILARMSAAAAAHPQLAQVVDLTARYGVAPTWEGRAIHAMRISDNVATDEDEPAFLLVSAHHCREIVTPVIALEAIDRLLGQYGFDPRITALVDAHEIWIAPNWNPDGYEYVFQVDNLWRKNRRNHGGGSFGVDLNRNYPFGWSSSCSGSSFPSSSTYKGPSAGSEPETAAMMAFASQRRFAKVIDFHSSGREVLWGYSCLPHPWGTSLLRPDAIALSNASGYGGDARPPSAEGENYQWHHARFGSAAFLVETHTSFQPSYASALAEASLVWPGILWLLERPISLSGHVTDLCTGAPLEAAIDHPGAAFQNGETNGSGGPFGRYHAFLPPGTTQVRFSAPGYASQTFPITATATSAQVLEVALAPVAGPQVYCTAKTNSLGCTPSIASSGSPSAGSGLPFDVFATAIRNNKAGILFYGTAGRAAVPFQGAFLCVSPPTKRTGVQVSGGTPSGSDCSGSFYYDFNARIASGADPALVPGATAQAQYWSRDPGDPYGTGLTDALEFTVCR